MSPGSESPILIIGTERSGSNLLRLVLNAHSRITIPHPPHFMRFLAPVAHRYGDLAVEGNRRRLVEDALALLERHPHPWPHPVDADRVVDEAKPTLFGVVAAIYDQHRAAERKARWGCKSTFMVNHVDDVLADYPNARFIWLVRDPCDVASSAKRSVFGYCHPYRMARLWREQQERGRTALAKWGPEVVHLLKYEDLVSDTEREVARLCDFLGERSETAMLEPHRSPAAQETAALSRSWRHVGEPISTGRVGHHVRGLSESERLLVDKVTAPVKVSLGYRIDPRSEFQPDPSRFDVALRSALLRLRVESRSIREDRNCARRLRRDLYVRLLRCVYFNPGSGRSPGGSHPDRAWCERGIASRSGR
ncbi:hypothetical protein GCM10010191_11280 [Actinomadura vinacea]|uniref:Sulfotransferase n=2 Tax=Actinomadura vinacea TaxID=115336 RepID=A0ABP5VLA6_9ACTN